MGLSFLDNPYGQEIDLEDSDLEVADEEWLPPNEINNEPSINVFTAVINTNMSSEEENDSDWPEYDYDEYDAENVDYENWDEANWVEESDYDDYNPDDENYPEQEEMDDIFAQNAVGVDEDTSDEDDDIDYVACLVRSSSGIISPEKTTNDIASNTSDGADAD